MREELAKLLSDHKGRNAIKGNSLQPSKEGYVLIRENLYFVCSIELCLKSGKNMYIIYSNGFRVSYRDEILYSSKSCPLLAGIAKYLTLGPGSLADKIVAIYILLKDIEGTEGFLETQLI